MALSGGQSSPAMHRAQLSSLIKLKDPLHGDGDPPPRAHSSSLSIGSPLFIPRLPHIPSSPTPAASVYTFVFHPQLAQLAIAPSSFCYSAGNAAAAVEREASPAAAEEREMRCSPAGSPVSSGSGSGKRAAAERSAGSGDEDDDGGARKKLRLSKDQAAVLEECFKTHHTLTPQNNQFIYVYMLRNAMADRSLLPPLQKQKVALASSLGLRPRQVEVWFQNRRARTKLKQTEVDCEYLKRWCEQLAEENRRLGKEVAELRALNAAAAASPAPAPAPPLTTLTMCLSCRRVASPPSNASNIPATHAHGAAGMVSPAATLPAHRQFFCGFGYAGAAAYGSSSGLAKAVKAAR
ncbi:hypothetical protein HU200_056311 [Digitaria exilis]|uniref:Homeobox domain-containing protein n=1 Tax=Digitaria exilis TaxID=1010633 RepID=A0A835AGS0_9POAL|nr:hypothetical protein HU200_056311 [Digitaria exilis]